jgi:hypothetical protein
MLPILRIVPVGGVLLAILILVLALTPPDGARAPFAQRLVRERGPLLNRDEHPEWRQLLIRAALRRADEINRLRELPDTPTRIAIVAPAPKTASEAATAGPSKPADDEALAHTQAEPTPTTVATIQPAAPALPPLPTPEPSPPVAAEIAQPPASEPAYADTSTPTEAANNESTVPPAATAQPVVAEPAHTEAPAAAAATVANLAEPATEPAADRRKSELTPGVATGSMDAAPQPPGANAMGAASPMEMPVMLPEKRPASADAPQTTKSTHRYRRRMRKAEAAVPVRPLTFFDLLFNNGTTKLAQATPIQPASQPSAAKNVAKNIAKNVTNGVAKNPATPTSPFSRDFGAYPN